MNEFPPTFIVDGIKAMAKHNGVIRIEFMRLSMDGKPIPTVELDVPANAMPQVIDALRKIT